MFANALRLCGVIIFAVSLLHIALGVRGENLLGAKLAAGAAENPSLDSQNRFYGAAFGLYGVLLWMCASDLERYRPIFNAVMIVFFLAGVARFVSGACPRCRSSVCSPLN